MAAILAVCPLMLAGCGALGGVFYPEGKKNTRDFAQHRFEYELIPNAELAKESTTPDWPLGRHVFKRGPDRLMVLTRITSFPVNMKKPSLGFRDARVERVWINIPLDVPVGQQFTLEESFTDFHVGYDRAEENLKNFYIRAIKPQGTVQVMAWRNNEIDVKLDIRVRPEMDLEWHITDVITVPIYPNGNWAREYVDPNFSVGGESLVDAGTQTDAQTTADQGTPATDATNPAVGVAQQNPANDAAKVAGGDAVKPADGEGEAPKGEAMAIAGMWINDEPAAPFELRYQFDDKGNFIMGSTRGGGNYAPGMKYGTYEIRGNDLIMDVSRYEFDGRDHMMYSNNHTIIVKAYMVDGDLILDGDLGGREGKRTVRLRSTKFPDMNFVLPPRGRSGKYQF
jgi:hypothetical protein